MAGQLAPASQLTIPTAAPLDWVARGAGMSSKQIVSRKLARPILSRPRPLLRCEWLWPAVVALRRLPEQVAQPFDREPLLKGERRQVPQLGAPKA